MTESKLKTAIKSLTSSWRGKAVCAQLYDFLNTNGLHLDSENQKAVLTILNAAFNNLPSTTLEALKAESESKILFPISDNFKI